MNRFEKVICWGFIWVSVGLAEGLKAQEESSPAEVEVQISDYLIRDWQTEHGLPQNTIETIVQTRDGYLWLGTYNGLVRFDGVHFTTFSAINTPGLRSDCIDALYEDHAGRLWIGTEGGGLSLYENGVFTTYFPTNNLSASIVLAITADREGVLWLGTPSGLYRFNGRNYDQGPELPGQREIGYVKRLTLDPEGRLWIGAANGLFYLQNGQVVKEPSFEYAGGMAADVSSGIWLGRETGLAHYVAGKETLYPECAGLSYTFLYQTRNGDVWIGTKNQGLVRWRLGQRTNYSIHEGLQVNDITAIFQDHEGNLWVGSNGGGLHRLKVNHLKTFSTKNGLPDNDVVALLEDRAGRKWIGSYAGGLTVLDHGQFKSMPGLPGKDAVAYALCEARDGSIWIGSPHALYRWREGQAVEAQPIEGESARIIFEDRAGNLWLGSRLRGLQCRRKEKVVQFGLAQGLSHNYVTGIVQDQQDTIWAGTKQGLNRISNDKITCYYRRDGLGADTIQTLYMDPQGILWVGTAGGGLSRLKDGRFVTLNTQQGLANDVIAQILEDGQGVFWMGSNAGIMRVKRTELIDCLEGRNKQIRCLTLNRHDGMLNPECAGSFQPSCFKSQEGSLWFATVGGIVMVHPDAILANTNPPPVHIEFVRADETEYGHHPFGESPNTPVIIPRGRAQLEIDYTGLSYAAPERVHFRFRLEGWDNNWVEAGTRRTAYYLKVPPGNYQFRVMARNNDGVWNDSAASMALVIQPFWHQTRWFRLSAILGLTSLLGITLRVVQKNHLRRELERVEQRNTRLRAEELGLANQQLQARKRELEDALANVKELRGLIPICAACKKVRDDQGFWNHVEKYIQQHSHAKFSHGMCPECMAQWYPDYSDEPAPRATDPLGPDI